MNLFAEKVMPELKTCEAPPVGLVVVTARRRTEGHRWTTN